MTEPAKRGWTSAGLKIIEAGNALGLAKNAAPKAVDTENQDYAMKALTELLKGGNEQSIFNKGISALSTLDQMKNTTGQDANYWLQNGTPAQKQYVQGLYAQVQALKQLEDALGNNGNAFIASINAVVLKVTGGQQALHDATMIWLTNIETKFAALTAQVQSGTTFNHK